MTSGKKISPEIELKTKDGYKWFVYSEKDTGLRLVCLEDTKTGAVVTTPLADPQKRIAAHKAWAGARHSRAPGTPWEIMHEMGKRGVDPDKKLEMMFKNYGHASVGDMASIQIDLVNIPMHLAYSLFNLSAINSGQEKSSRYQKKFGECVLHKIDNYNIKKLCPVRHKNLSDEYESFGQLSLELFSKHKEKITDAFVKHYKPKDKGQEKSLESRVLDCVRFFLLLGQDTGLSYETSARDWVRIIANLKASPVIYYQNIAKQIERLLTPSAIEEKKLGYKAEAPSLVEFTQALLTTNENLARLKKFIIENTNLLTKVDVNTKFKGARKQKVELIPSNYSTGDKMLIQYLLTIWPGLNKKKLFTWVRLQKSSLKGNISKIIFKNHSHHGELSDLAATSGVSLVIDGFIGELRDFNRHRAWGRFGALPLVHGLKITKETMMQIINKGFGLPLYLTEVKRFDGLKREFEKDLKVYYKKLFAFIEKVDESGVADYSFMINLLPLAHACELFMHGGPKQAFYFTHLRTRYGGHINYRDLAFQANQLITNSDSLLEGMRLTKKPNPRSRKEFFERS